MNFCQCRGDILFDADSANFYQCGWDILSYTEGANLSWIFVLMLKVGTFVIVDCIFTLVLVV